MVRFEWAEFGRGSLTVVELVERDNFGGGAQRTMVTKRGLFFSGGGGSGGKN